MRNSDKEVDSMSKISGYTSFDVGFQKNIYEKAKPENKRTDKKPVEKYGAAQKMALKQPAQVRLHLLRCLLHAMHRGSLRTAKRNELHDWLPGRDSRARSALR